MEKDNLTIASNVLYAKKGIKYVSKHNSDCKKQRTTANEYLRYYSGYKNTKNST